MPLTPDVQKIGGLDLPFLPEAVPNATESDRIAHTALRLLMMGWQTDGSLLRSKWATLLKAILINRNLDLLAVRRAFQTGFTHLHTQLKDKQLTSGEHEQINLFLSNCLAILPFADITPYESFTIPQYINDQWALVPYKVTPIELTPTKGFFALFIAPQDRVFAYGLEPINTPDAEPHLIFMGTTYPAGQGFITSVDTDLEGFETVGKKLYRTGHANITAWLDKQTKKPQVCGSSLGGSLSLLLAIHQGDRLSRVNALNPAGLYSPLRKSRFDKWDTFSEQPPVFIQRQGRDPVSQLGVWKKEWTLLHVQPPKEKQGPTGVYDHALNYAGFKETTFTQLDTQADNARRKWRNLFLYTLGRSVLYYLVMVPFRHLILPTLRFIFSHKLILTCAAGLLALSFLLSPIAVALLPCVVIALAIPLLIKLVDGIRTLIGKRPVDVVDHHHPALPRDPALNVYQKPCDATFTVRELKTYYQTIYEIKGKTMPTDGSSNIDKPSLREGKQKRPLHVTFHNGSSKQAILTATEESMDKRVTITATQAKVHHIRQTVHYLTKFGSPLDTSQLRPQHEAYKEGKPRLAV